VPLCEIKAVAENKSNDWVFYSQEFFFLDKVFSQAITTTTHE